MPPLLPRAQFPLPLQRIVLRKDKDRPEDVREIPSGEKGAGVGDRKQEPRGPVPSLDIQSPSGPNSPRWNQTAELAAGKVCTFITRSVEEQESSRQGA